MNTNDDWLTPFVQQRVASIIATINDLTAWYEKAFWDFNHGSTTRSAYRAKTRRRNRRRR